MKIFAGMWLIFLSVWISAIFAATSQSPRDIRNMMTAKQFQDAGLTKLSEEEITVLNDWLTQALAVSIPQTDSPVQGAKSDPEPDAESRFGVTEEMLKVDEPEKISARLVGKFDGWSPGTRFKLDNGQIWKVIDRREYRHHETLDSPSVVIRKGLFSYRLSLEGSGRAATVERVE